MDNLNIPINRALKLGTKDEYIEGYLVPCEAGSDKLFISIKKLALIFTYEIDPSTLSIHFPDMADSEGTRIFASLSEDGWRLATKEEVDSLHYEGKN